MPLVGVDPAEDQEPAGLWIARDAPEGSQVERVQEQMDAIVRHPAGLAQHQPVRGTVGDHTRHEMPEHGTVVETQEESLDTPEVTGVEDQPVGVDQQRLPDDPSRGHGQLEDELRIVVMHDVGCSQQLHHSRRDLRRRLPRPADRADSTHVDGTLLLASRQPLRARAHDVVVDGQYSCVVSACGLSLCQALST